MNKIGKINFREIKRISPSQFISMKNCAYKSLLAEAFEKKPLLPVSPNAYLGIVLHKMLELIAKGEVRNDAGFNKSFDEQVRSVEETLFNNGYNFFIPLQKNVKDYGLKKILLKKHLSALSEQPTISNNAEYHSEKWFESKDKLLAGKIDLIIITETDLEIIDFKTGAIMEDVLDDSGEVFTEVKEEYKAQLKLYAYLYFENTGNLPTKLSLVDLAKQKFTVDFSLSECIEMFEEAKKLLQCTNESIDTGIFDANPTQTNCRYCLYRPACSFYQCQLNIDVYLNDVTGSLRNVVKYQNGNVSVFMQSGDRQITITNFPSARYNVLKDSVNKNIGIYNLRKEATEFVFSATKTTMIYE